MDRTVYEEWFELETYHWWFVGRRHLFLRLIEAILPDLPRSGRRLRIADIGCGTGVNLDALAPFGTVVGTDISDTALAFCRERKPYVLCQAPMASLPYRTDSIDLLTAFDVLEHGEDDRAMLDEAFRVCTPGGMALFSVPAYAFMWGDHDVAAHHFRRYTAADIRGRVEASGFAVHRITHVNTLLFPVSVVFRHGKNALGGALRRLGRETPARSDFRSTAPPLLNPLLLRVFRTESRLLHHFDLPFGLTICCIARKPPLSRRSSTYRIDKGAQR